jgi:hypothetical protein
VPFVVLFQADDVSLFAFHDAAFHDVVFHDDDAEIKNKMCT